MSSKETNKLIKLSASRAKTFDQCPRKYYYHYEEHLPTKEWDHLELGTYSHAVLEIFHKYIINGSKESWRKLMSLASNEAFKKTIEKGHSLSNEQISEAKTILSSYLSNIEEKGMPNVMEVEFPFTIELNNKYDLTGVIDRLDYEDGFYHIVDYKTNKNAKYMDPFQLNTYGLFLVKKFPEVTRFKASYIMLRLDCQRVSYEFTIEDVTKCHNRLIEYADKIMSEERWIAKPSKLCDWCDFKDVCFSSW